MKMQMYIVHEYFEGGPSMHCLVHLKADTTTATYQCPKCTGVVTFTPPPTVPAIEARCPTSSCRAVMTLVDNRPIYVGRMVIDAPHWPIFKDAMTAHGVVFSPGWN